MSFFDSDATKGWTAVVVACFCFGSFGIPIKHPSVIKAGVHPLTFQTYKSFWCFVTSWLVLLWHDLDFTPWGFVSAGFWVPAGVAAVISISNCGLAVGQGIWTSLIVIVSFVWGAFIFQEEFKSLPMAFGGAAMIIVGAIGMTYFGIKKEDEASAPTKTETAFPANNTIPAFAKDMLTPVGAPKGDSLSDDEESVESSGLSSSRKGHDSEAGRDGRRRSDDEKSQSLLSDTDGEPSSHGTPERRVEETEEEAYGHDSLYTRVCGMRIRRRTYGILAAVFNGCYGGSVMAPLKLAPKWASGISFVISFGVGVLGITTLLWVVWWLAYTTGRTKEPLPSLQLRVMLIPGSIAGLLWATGNFASIYAVIYLGQAVGYSSCQANIAISGLWGIFYYQEQVSKNRIALWFVAAAVTIGGIVVLTVAH